MENILLSPDEHQLVLKDKKFLESKFNVNILLPQCVSFCERDVAVATVVGGKSDLIQNFVQRRLEKIKKREQRITVQNNVAIITLSDSDSDGSIPVLTERQQNRKRRGRRGKKKKKMCVKKEMVEPSDLSSTILVDDSGESSNENPVPKRPRVESPLPPVNLDRLKLEKENSANFDKTSSVKDEFPACSSFIPLYDREINASSGACNEIDNSILQINSLPVKSETNSAGFVIDVRANTIIKEEDYPISSASFIPFNHRKVNRNSNDHNELDGSVILIDSKLPAGNCLSSGSKKGSIPDEVDDSVIILDDDEIPSLIKEPKRLRPIVIDGSNVAREHGKISNTFSCNGIKIAIDYFLKRGHEQVTAFVPHYRRHNKFGPILTTDQPLLEELAKHQLVVFTPSRRLNNKSYACYDDRFIVELASTTGGVILSNDNYRDLLEENEEFKKTIEERLLMFCFVGDIIMIPKDPLGRNGPSLDDFLSFPS